MRTPSKDKVRITVALEPATYARLRDEARLHDRSISWFASFLIDSVMPEWTDAERESIARDMIMQRDLDAARIDERPQ